MSGEAADAPLYGVAAEYAADWQIVEAALAVHAQGFGRIDAVTPMPIPALARALGVRQSSLPVAGAIAAALGSIAFFAMCVYATTASYDFLIGGRPAFSWPYYVIPSVSIGMLCGALTAALGMLFLNRLPQLNHPTFNIVGIEGASRDRYILIVEPRDDRFDPERVAQFLRATAPRPLLIQMVPR